MESEVVPETFGVSKKVCETSARPLCVGVPPQGRNHLRCNCELSGAQLKGVQDSARARLRRLCPKHSVAALECQGINQLFHKSANRLQTPRTERIDEK